MSSGDVLKAPLQKLQRERLVGLCGVPPEWLPEPAAGADAGSRG